MNYIAVADGGCSQNGKWGAKAYGSFILYRAPDVPAPPPIPEDTRGLVEQVPPTPETLQALESVVKHVNRRPFILGSVPRKTNNLAEAMALQMLVHHINEQGLLHHGNHVTILMDSALVVNQMTGVYRVNAAHLKDIYKNINRILAKTSKIAGKDVKDMVSLLHIPGTVVKQILGH